MDESNNDTNASSDPEPLGCLFWFSMLIAVVAGGTLTRLIASEQTWPPRDFPYGGWIRSGSMYLGMAVAGVLWWRIWMRIFDPPD
jgi:hypothetical protein